VADVLDSKPRGTSVIVVILPLQYLMNDQVQYLNNLCIPAIAITDEEDPEIIQQVLNGTYVYHCVWLSRMSTLNYNLEGYI
jgi:superfamily II DNA helicase RecQ